MIKVQRRSFETCFWLSLNLLWNSSSNTETRNLSEHTTFKTLQAFATSWSISYLKKFLKMMRRKFGFQRCQLTSLSVSCGLSEDLSTQKLKNTKLMRLFKSILEKLNTRRMKNLSFHTSSIQKI